MRALAHPCTHACVEPRWVVVERLAGTAKARCKDAAFPFRTTVMNPSVNGNLPSHAVLRYSMRMELRMRRKPSCTSSAFCWPCLCMSPTQPAAVLHAPSDVLVTRSALHFPQCTVELLQCCGCFST